ncbi:hypothetical protein BJY01DRAFT_29058 [Aspergillus pseudoustus]|uniref:Azaphilone pigments biosynthesis cluster protein L N-terminal domain-containing protein n=1 Tax=Aspergillus pseudoustus TaxID=1810923 RepID=A0ABR4JHI8_9EURO
MADPISLASGLLALATFAFQSSVSLCDMVKSFRSHPTRVRELLQELEALSGVLGPLVDKVQSTSDTDLSVLNLPLLQCGKACDEFKHEITKCAGRSSATRTSFRDWAKLKYMGDDIDGFRRVLSAYKLTINIALTDANLQKSTVTAEALENYESLIETAKADLEAHLEAIDEKLELILGKAAPGSAKVSLELKQIKEERLSAEKCLQICAQLSEHISQIQISPASNGSAGSSDPDALSERLTSAGLQECKESLKQTSEKLELHMHNLIDRLLSKSASASESASQEELTDLARLRDEWKTTRQCIDICSKADINFKEAITTVDNYATGDAVQFMVSTDGQVIHGRNRGLGWRSRQVGGHLNDTSLQQLSKDFTTINIHHPIREDLSSPDKTTATASDIPSSESTSEFDKRYGRGSQLTPTPAPSVTGPWKGSTDSRTGRILKG